MSDPEDEFEFEEEEEEEDEEEYRFDDVELRDDVELQQPAQNTEEPVKGYDALDLWTFVVDFTKGNDLKFERWDNTNKKINKKTEELDKTLITTGDKLKAMSIILEHSTIYSLEQQIESAEKKINQLLSENRGPLIEKILSTPSDEFSAIMREIREAMKAGYTKILETVIKNTTNRRT